MKQPTIEIPYYPKPHQAEFLSWEPDGQELLVKAIITGYGGGKTNVLVRDLFKYACWNAPIPALHVAPTYPMLRDIVAQEYIDFFDAIGMRYEYNKSDHTFVVPLTRARIWLRSGDNPNSLKGPNVCAAAIDEPFIQDESVLKQLFARVRHPKAKSRVLMIGGTPEMGVSWGQEYLMGDGIKLTRTIQAKTRFGETPVYIYEGRKTVKVKDTETSYAIKWVNCSLEANDELDESYIAGLLESHTEHEAQAYVQGRLDVGLPGRIYYAYETERDCTFELDPNLPVIVMCDFNASECPMSWNIAQERGNETLVRYALWKQYTNTEAMCQVLESALPFMPTHIDFYGDYSGNRTTSNSQTKDWEIIKEYFRNKSNIRVNTRPCKSVRQSAAAVNAMLCNADGAVRLRLHKGPDTEHLRKDLMNVTWKSNSVEQDARDHMRTHAGDALRYYCDIVNPIIPKMRVGST